MTLQGNIQGISRRKYLSTTIISTSVSLLTGCLGGGGTEDTITIGGLQPYSGPFAAYANPYERGFEFARENINEDGGVLDKELDYNGVDTETEPGEAVSIARQLVQEENAIALVGPVSSDVGITTSDTAEDLEVPLFLHASGTHAVLDTDSRYTYRVGHLPAPTTIQAQAHLIEEEGYETIGAIIGDYAWGHAVKTSIEEFIPDGINVEIHTAPFDESDFTPYLRNMSEDIDMLIGSGHPAGIHDIFRQMLELGLEPELVTAGLQEPTASFDAIGEDITQGFAYFHQPEVSSQEYQEIAQEFYDETGEYFGTTHALGYVTCQLIAGAIENADSEDPVEVSNAVRDIEFNTLFANPIQYTEWGELENQSQIYSQFELSSPDHYPEGEFSLSEIYQSQPLEAYNPDELPLE